VLRFLAERAEVDLAALADEPVADSTYDALGQLTKRCELIPLDKHARWFRAAWSLLMGQSATEGLFASRPLQKTVEAWCADVEYDLVMVVCSSMAHYLPKVLAGNPKKLIDLIDVDSRKWVDYAANARGLKKQLYKLEARRVAALEASLVDTYDRISLTTTEEVACFRQLSQRGKVFALPNGVDSEFFRPNPSVEVIPNSCVFVGALDYKPNIEGVQWFCDAVWPHIVDARPDASFTIVGRRPAPSVLQLGGLRGVQVVADVPDVRPYLWKARVAVAPLQIARGIQNKVLETMSCGVPTLVSPEAYCGLMANAGGDLKICRAAEDWVESLVALFTDPKLCYRFATHGRRHVLEQHDWDCCLADLVGLLPRRHAAAPLSTSS
jgi:sugar transferase (PEP-CTERM/EpsH1 system associated)